MVKKTIISAITAIICVALICGSVSSGVKTYSNAMKEAAANAAAGGSSDEGGLDEVGLDEQGGLDSSTDGTATDDGTGDAAGDTTSDATGDATGDAAGDATGDAPAGNAGNATQGSAKPADGVATLNYYNKVISQAVSAKPGYDKSRVTDNAKMEGSAGLEAMKDLVYQFMGIGEENKYTEKVEKGKWGDVSFLNVSKLSASDVTAATCKESGDNYVITLKLKSGSSAADKSNPTTAPNTALDKCGICVGSEDKGYYDHKTASVIYSAIGGTFASAVIKESYSNAIVTATVNAETGNLVSLVVEWNQKVQLSKLMAMSADASGVSHVRYENFKY